MLTISVALAAGLGWSRRNIALGERVGVGGITFQPPAGWTRERSTPVVSGPTERFDSPASSGFGRTLLVEYLGDPGDVNRIQIARFFLDRLIGRTGPLPSFLPLAGRPQLRPFGPMPGARILERNRLIAVFVGSTGDKAYAAALVGARPLSERDLQVAEAVVASVRFQD